MTKEQIAYMFNHQINFFWLEKDIMVYREKRGGAKYFGIDDISVYTEEDIEKEVKKPICEFKTLDELFKFEYKGKTIKDWLDPLQELNIDNFA